MKNVLIISATTDIAGVGISLKNAFDQHSSEWQARMVRRRDAQWHYPTDIEWREGDTQTGQLVADLFAKADVIHVLQDPDVVKGFAGWQRKAIVVHHLGSYFTADPEEVSRRCRAIGAVEMAGALYVMGPGMEFLPIVADIDTFAALRDRTYKPSPRIRIAHAPTNRIFKSTAVIQEAVETLAQKYPVDFDLIENVPWAECLKRKAHADIFVDELTDGYGANAIEAWAMGIPVVSGIADNRVRELMVAMFGGMPFIEAFASSLYRVLETLVIDPELRASVALRGSEHVRRFHSGESVVARAIAIYERALA